MLLHSGTFAAPASDDTGDLLHRRAELIIILVSGLFVGMVLGLQGYDTLARYGSTEALGVLVACRWCANWAPWSPHCCLPAAPARRSRRKSA
jgi:hypothetical protein